MDSADILYQHPNNLTINEGSVTHTDKKWAKELRGISREQLKLHTQRLPDGSHVQDWSALHPETYDDFLRRGERSVQPNARHCHNLKSEADGLAYFKLEIAAPVLSKFIRYPALSCNAEASTGRGGLITDELYKFNDKHAVMVEGKRNLFEADLWFKGKFDKRDDQVKLCRELRG
ncbi:hypothetical protein CEP51_014220 [Fusarium floridanum]|uniref:Uncharacterized protein n=1 Tax=Fusarium floridanum TaxID=1325733 RepID=A0A428PX31_9HYPO|nr:hypothetical protein CEP51_014220 [Fusarium floridanum]